jgi:hypothetical protein
MPTGRTKPSELSGAHPRRNLPAPMSPRVLAGRRSVTRRARQLHLVGWQIEYVAELDMDDVEALADELAALYRLRRHALGAQPRVS